MKTRFSDKCHSLWQLTCRSLKIFLSDKAGVFFSLIAPLIILLLYVLFLGDMQLDSLKTNFGGVADAKLLKAFVDSWMLSGVLAVACITVSLSANSIMINDRQKGATNDMLASPVSPRVVTLAYFLYNLIVTFIICMILFAVCMAYLAISGGFCLSARDFFETLLIMLLSIVSASTLTVLVSSMFKTNSAFSAFSGIISAAIGFVIGAYMPVSMYPKAVQSVVCFFPGSYGAGLLRNSLMRGALSDIIEGMPPEAAAFAEGEMSNAYSLTLDFFGAEVDVPMMYVVLTVTTVVLLAANVAKAFIRRKQK